VPIACPACNKANQTEAACQRCGCDLARLHEIRAAAVACLGGATAALADGDWTAALSAAARSWRLRHTAESARIAFLAAAAAGDTARTLHWRQRATDGESA